VRHLLVTGQNGFVGRHLQAALAAGQYPGWNLIAHQAHDLLQPHSLDAWLQQQHPQGPIDAVIHLAGQTFVPAAFNDPERTLQVNLLGTLHLLQALKRRGFAGTFLYVSSGDVYGQVAPEHLPIRETLAPQPRNPYAVSKVAAELLCLQWGLTEPGWRVLVARPFNHIGTGQAASFVLSNMAQQLQQIRQGRQAPVLQVGDVDVTRDFLAVEDVLAAYFALLAQGQAGEIYNVCSGHERCVRDLITDMALQADLDVRLEQDAQRLRRAEQRRVVGDNHKLQAHTGWQPRHDLGATLRAVFHDWEERER